MVTLDLARPHEPDPDSVDMMMRIDGLSKAMRVLVREYGWIIVRDMIDDGYTDPFELAGLLETWRARRQEEWLNTDFITRKTAQSIADALQYGMATRRAKNTSYA